MRGPRSSLAALKLSFSCSLGLAACTPPPAPESPPATGPAPASQQLAAPPGAPASSPTAEGEQWTGVYQGPYHSYLAIQQQGEEATGKWKSTAGRMGEFTGTINKHRLELAWSEHDQAGNSWTGRGYFLYRGAEAGRPPQIYGEWGLGQARRGDAWWAVKRVDSPTPASVQNEEGRAREGSDDRLCPGCDEVEYER